MSLIPYDLELAHRRIEDLVQANHRYPESRKGSRPVAIQTLGRVMIRVGEALGGRQPSPAPLYPRPKTAVRLS